MKELIINKDFAGLRKMLLLNPSLANQGWPYDEKNVTLAHPLHRICDLVFTGKITDEEGVKTAEIFLESGADVNGGELIVKKDSPLVAASSLHADLVALLYLDHGANIHHPGCHGGTALHWAAWCGREPAVARLIKKGAVINQRCIDFLSTPLFWAVMSFVEKNDPHDQIACIKLLLDHGADATIPNAGGKTVFEMAKGVRELENML